MTEDNFTPSQMGALLEAMDKKIELIAEAVSPIPEKLEKIEDRLGNVGVRLTAVEDAVRVAIPFLVKRVDRIESRL